MLKLSTFRFLLACSGLMLGLILTGCRTETADLALPDQVDFNFHIRPILSGHCFTCHGPDPSSRQANLRLDTYEGATALLKSGKRAIDPGHWRGSELIRRTSSSDPELVMPPPEANNPLSARDIALLKKWIGQGAEWKQYWAFIPPDTAQYDSQRAIDEFIAEPLQLNGLEAAPPADKGDLIRRLSYHLTGLPPSPEEIEEFLDDQSAEAYEKLVDTLLTSPHFGERWARHWMDLVRYAETMGHEFDYPVVGAWRYRDYLIRAFNQDLPYDQLIKEHLAGDLLQPQRYDPETGLNESLLATLFYNLGEGKHSPVDIRREEYDRILNTIDVTTKTFQALTLGCAQCHDHKFDPLPTSDYYALYGIFESTRLSTYPVNTGLQQMAHVDSMAAHKKAIRQLIADMTPPPASAPRAITISQKLEEEVADSQAIQVLADFRRGDLHGWTINGDAFASGNTLAEPLFDPVSRRLQGFDSGKASSRSYGPGIQGTLRSPTFTIDHDFITIRAAGMQSTVRLVIHNFQLIQDPIHGAMSQEVKQEEMKDLVMDVHMWRGMKAYLELMTGRRWKNGQRHHYSIEPDAWVEAEYVYFHNDPAATPPVPASLVANKPLQAHDLQDWVEGKTRPEIRAYLQQQLSAGHMRPADPAFTPHLKALQELNEKIYEFSAFAGVSEGDPIFSPVFVRGNHQQLEPEPQRHRYLTIFADRYPDFPDEGSGRLQLAEAIADAGNPLTARVMVNRIWHHLFGRGLVETVDNFGLQGKIPSHPALLDHLALRFIEQGWSVKKLIREIVLSETFRRSSVASELSSKRDPENIWLQHYPVRRLEAEAIRDGILAASGQLDLSLYGPPIPVHLTPFMQGRGRPGKSGPLDGAGRRSVYQAIRRNFLSPMMLTFDQPAPSSTFGRRNVTNVPAQSLNLMNDPFVQEQAVHWAKRIVASPASFEERLKEIYLTAFARLPEETDLAQARNFFSEQGQLIGLSADASRESEQVWADYCQVIYNAKEFIFLE